MRPRAPSFALLLLFAAAAAPARSSERSYTMHSAVYYKQQAQWNQFLQNHNAEVAREQAIVQSLNAQQLHSISVHPAYEPQAPREVPVWRGPSFPPEMREFKDEFAALVAAYVKNRTKDGVFAVDDGATQRRYELKLLNVHGDRVTRLDDDSFVGCADFETVAGAKEALDLDFFVKKNDENAWGVEKVMIHSVNGKSRYAIDDGGKLVAPPRPASAWAAAPRAVPKPVQPAHLSAQVVLSEPSGDGVLEGGETGALSVKVVNAGPGPAYAVRLALDPEKSVEGLSMPTQVQLGDIKAGQTVAKEIPIVASENTPTTKVDIRLSINEANGFDTEPVSVEFRAKASHPPKLELAAVEVGGGGLVMAGEATKISVTVRNAGKGPARVVSAELGLGSKDLFMSGDAVASLGTIGPQKSKKAEFEFFANRRLQTGQALPVTLTLKESSGRHGVESAPLHLVMGRSAPSVTVLALGEGQPAPEADSAPAADKPEVDSPPASRSARNPDAYAVVIGIERYRDMPSADYASRDAGIIYAYLTQAMGFDAKNVILLQNERATLTDMATYLGPWLKDHATAKSRVFLYYAGHGTVDPKTGASFIVPYDGDPAYTDTKAFPLQKLYDGLAQLPTDDITVALDSCFSGAGGRSLIAKGTRPLVMSAVGPKAGANMVVLSAARGDQVSTDDPDTRHGMLTYYLLRGLHGEARDGGGRVTTKRLFEFVKPAVERAARERHVEQSPVLSPAVEDLGSRGSRVWLQTK